MINLSQFGYRELDMAGDLLKKVSEGSSGFETIQDWECFPIGDLELGFNPNSGNVYLYNEDCSQTYMLNNNGKAEQFISCPDCGVEDFATTGETKFTQDGLCEDCQQRKNLLTPNSMQYLIPSPECRNFDFDTCSACNEQIEENGLFSITGETDFYCEDCYLQYLTAQMVDKTFNPF